MNIDQYLLRDYCGLTKTVMLFRYLGSKRPEASWIVRQDTKMPGGYPQNVVHPHLKIHTEVIDSSDSLHALMSERIELG